MTAPTLVEPACPGAPGPSDRRAEAPADPAPTTTRRITIQRRDVAQISRETWDDIFGRTPWATPFSSWPFQMAWWEAYGETAHEQTVVAIDAEGSQDDNPIAIVPLMHRHEVEPTDAERQTRLRHGHDTDLTPVSPTAKAIFFGASYHADYATILAAPADLPAVSEALVEHLAAAPAPDDPHPALWDVIDLRRLRCGDPAAEALASAFGRREIDRGWRLNVEREDVCPVVTLPDGVDFEGYLSTLEKKSRHEVRRKIRRAESVGEVRLEPSHDPLADLDAFIDLHQRRWGADGLFPPTPGGDASRLFVRRLFELGGLDGPVQLCFLSVGGRRIASGIHVESADTVLFYNAGIDPDARDLSPGVLLAAKYIEHAIGAGKRRFDFLRGDEPYKYEWGAVDEPIQRLLVRRDEGVAR